MAFFLPTLLALYIFPTASVLAEEIPVPNCYINCFHENAVTRGDCDILDIDCLCTKAWFTTEVICCFSRSCPDEHWDGINDYVKACQTTFIHMNMFPTCRPLSTRVSGSVMITRPSTTIVTTTATPSAITNTVSPLASFNDLSPPIASFSGASIFTGSCTSPKIALTSTASEGQITAYPWMGCSMEDHGCCPFVGNEIMLLTICPHDYTTTANACCPSEWMIYTTDFGGQTPCYTSIDTGLTTITPLPKDATLITDLAFTMRYELNTADPQGLSNGVLAGIIIGAVVGGVCLIGVIGHFVLRRKQTRRHSAAIMGANAIDFPKAQSPPQELPGSIFIHENHPAFNTSGDRSEPASTTKT